MREAKAAVERAKALRDGISVRGAAARRHDRARSRRVPTQALALVHMYVSEYLRDALPLSVALAVFGLLGFSRRLDHHEAELALLEELAPHSGEDWWFLGCLGWAYIETEIPMRHTSAFMVSSKQVTRPVAPTLSRVASGLRAIGASALPSLVAPRSVRACSRQQRAGPRDLPRQHPANGRPIGPHALARRLRIIPVALAALWSRPIYLRAMGRGRRAGAAALSPGQSRLRRSPRGLRRDRDRGRRRIAGSNQRAQ